MLLDVMFSTKLQISVPDSTSGQMLICQILNTISKIIKTKSKRIVYVFISIISNENAHNNFGDFAVQCGDIHEQTMHESCAAHTPFWTF